MYFSWTSMNVKVKSFVFDVAHVFFGGAGAPLAVAAGNRSPIGVMTGEIAARGAFIRSQGAQAAPAAASIQCRAERRP